MTDRESFVRAVLRTPTDNTLRLVYADWLQENGEPERAEFIRVQVELAAYPNASDTPQPNHITPTSRWLELRAREKELLAKHETAWRRAGPCPECGGDGRVPAPWAAGHGGQAPVPCTACSASGDRGGLLRQFDYDAREGIRTRFTVAVRVEWRCGFPEVVLVPRLSDCVVRITQQCEACYQLIARHSPGGAAVRRCGDCDGGSVSALATTPWLAAVVAHHPVEQVVPLDREPYHVLDAPSHWAHFFNGSDFYRWWCYRPVGSHPPEHERAIVPERIYEMVKGEHATRDGAVAALGLAIVTWARGVL